MSYSRVHYNSVLRGYGSVKVTPKRVILQEELDDVNAAMREIVRSNFALWRLEELSARACNLKAELRALRASEGYDVPTGKPKPSMTDRIWSRPKRRKR